MILNLFTWWATVITAGILFIVAASTYLYANTRNRREKSKNPTKAAGRLIKDFVFIWVMLSLLTLYIISIGDASPTLFAAGNIAVEIILIIYLLKNVSEQK